MLSMTVRVRVRVAGRARGVRGRCGRGVVFAGRGSRSRQAVFAGPVRLPRLRRRARGHPARARREQVPIHTLQWLS